MPLSCTLYWCRTFFIISTGWGRTVAGGSAADTLQQAMLPVAAHRKCSRVNGRLLPVDEKSMVCAGGQGKGGCQVHCNYHELNFNTHCNPLFLKQKIVPQSFSLHLTITVVNKRWIQTSAVVNFESILTEKKYVFNNKNNEIRVMLGQWVIIKFPDCVTFLVLTKL